MPPREKDFSFQRRLAQEIKLWLKEGIILPEQKERILARYAVLKKADERAGPGKLITIISLLGAILVGVGVILFIASNWSAIPQWGRLAIIFSSMIASYGCGFYLRYEAQNYPKVGAALILLGALIFGGGMFLIAQIYHISVHYPNGPLLWGLFVLPLAYLLRYKSLISVAILVLLTWLGMEASFWITNSAYHDPLAMVFLFCMAGVTLWGVGVMHRGWEPLANISGPYILIGSLVTFFAVYLLTFDLYALGSGSDALVLFYLGMAAFFLIAVVLQCLFAGKEKGWFIEPLGLLIFMIIMLYFSRAPLKITPANMGVLRLFFNILFALAIVGIIILGFVRRYSVYINIGLLFFALDVVTRYFDFFWRLLPRSLFFIVGGLLLLLGGVFLERKRRKILASFNIEEAD